MPADFLAGKVYVSAVLCVRKAAYVFVSLKILMSEDNIGLHQNGLGLIIHEKKHHNYNTSFIIFLVALMMALVMVIANGHSKLSIGMMALTSLRL